MAITEKLALLVTMDAKGAVKGFESIGKAADKNLKKVDGLDKTAAGMKKAGAGMLAAGGLAAAGLFKAGQAASKLEQSVGGTEAVFKANSAAIARYAKNADQSMGLSERAFREATTSIGGQLKRMTGDLDFATDKSIELTGVAADLAATYGGTTAEAVQALGAAFRGEADPAERFNLNLKIGAANAKAVALGLAETESSVSEAARAQATYALIMEQSADAQGQFAREANTAAGAQARMSASLENLQASVGSAVAPIMADLADTVGGLADGFNSLPGPAQSVISKLATFGTLGLVAGGGLAFVVGKAIEIRSTLGKLAGPFRTAEGGLSRLGKAASIAGGVTGIVGLTLAASEMGKNIKDGVLEVDKLSRSLGNLGDGGREAALGMLASQAVFGDLDKALKDLATTAPAVAQQLLDSGLAAELGADKVELLRKELDRSTSAQVAASSAQEKYNRRVQGLEDAAKGAAPALDRLEGATGDLISKQAAAKTTARGLITATEDLTEAFENQFTAIGAHFNSERGYEGALLNVAEAQKRIAEIQAEGDEANVAKARRVRDARENLADVESRIASGDLQGTDATRARRDAQEALADAQKESTDVADALAVAYRDLDEAQIAAAEAAAQMRTDQMEANGETVTGATEAKILAEEYGKVATTLDPASPLRVRLTELATQLSGVAGDYEINLKSNIQEFMNSTWSRFRELLDFNVGPSPFQKILDLVPTRRAVGGAVSMGVPYLVGENGPELFMPNGGGGTIDPRPFGGGSGSGSTVNQSVVINNPAPEPASRSARALRRVAVEMAA